MKNSLLDMFRNMGQDQNNAASAPEQPEFRIVYGISRWNNTGRTRTRHIDGGNTFPLCETKQKVFTWEWEQGTIENVTCDRCKQIYLEKTGGSHEYDN